MPLASVIYLCITVEVTLLRRLRALRASRTHLRHASRHEDEGTLGFAALNVPVRASYLLQGIDGRRRKLQDALRQRPEYHFGSSL
jgi:hypothetical protein